MNLFELVTEMKKLEEGDAIFFNSEFWVDMFRDASHQAVLDYQQALIKFGLGLHWFESNGVVKIFRKVSDKRLA